MSRSERSSAGLRRLAPAGLACLAVACAARTAAPAPAAFTDGPKVQIETGTLAGLRRPDGTLAFLGVPYAAPPTGARRWRPPESAPAGQGVRPATRFGPACPQDRAELDAYRERVADLVERVPGLGPQELRASEDCLHLDVWAPPLDGRRRAVIVWLHGGANVAGVAQVPLLGPAFARRGIVLVSVSYRLGALGFLAHPALTAESLRGASGNQGIADQLAALRWVQRNIAAFGGDPERVTLAGEAAGAVDACLILSAAVPGLLKGAILQSGDCVASRLPERTRPVPSPATSGRSAEADGAAFAEGLAPGAGLQALRAVPVERLLAALADSAGDAPNVGGPIVDGAILAAQPMLVFARSGQARVPLLVGANADEGTFFAEDAPVTAAGYQRLLEELFGDDSDLARLTWYVGADAGVKDAFVRLTTDLHAHGAWLLARAQARAELPVFQYRFTGHLRGRLAPLGATHGAELFYLQGLMPREAGPMEPGEAAVSSDLLRRWARFAEIGDPNDPALIPWPQAGERGTRLLELGPRVREAEVADQARLGVLSEITARVRARVEGQGASGR